MDGQARRTLLRQWRENEIELRRLLELPVGAVDPAERERQLLAEQGRIEYLLDLDMHQARRLLEDDPFDPPL